jgi:CHAD domain-containing protein
MNDASLLRQPVARAVRVVALSLLEEANAAAARLRAAAPGGDDAAPHDEEALHDFRVAVRRLRSWLRAWESWLGDSLSRKVMRRLRKIARATGPARDAEVHLAWLAQQRPALRGRQRVGLSWMIETLTSKQTAAIANAVHAAHRFGPVHDKASARLNVYTLSIHPVKTHDRELLAPALAQLVRHQSETVRRRLASVHTFEDRADAHRARIAVKRLRYLLEPAARSSDDGSAIVDQLKELQDILGDLHDVHVFAEEIAGAAEVAAAEHARRLSQAVLSDGGAARVKEMRSSDPAAGLIALEKRLHQRGLRAFERLERDWLGEADAPFFERVITYADNLAQPAARGRRKAAAAGPPAATGG